MRWVDGNTSPWRSAPRVNRPNWSRSGSRLRGRGVLEDEVADVAAGRQHHLVGDPRLHPDHVAGADLVGFAALDGPAAPLAGADFAGPDQLAADPHVGRPLEDHELLVPLAMDVD